jgi:hypothetical protein
MNLLATVMEKECVSCEAGIDTSNIIEMDFMLQRIEHFSYL